MFPDECPTTEELRSILQGRGPVGAEDRFAHHLSNCHACMAALDEQSLDGSVMSGLRLEASPGIPTAEEFEHVSKQFYRWGHVIQGVRRNGHLSSGTPSTHFELPGVFGQYRLVEMLGSGGMGIVYRAEDTALRRFVALKLLRPEVAHDPRFRERFLNEARAVAAVKHDNIVVIHQVGETALVDGPSMPFLAMELLEGQNLSTWMNDNPRMPTSWVLRLGRQAAAGLAAAHAQGLIHRDIKPANLWLEAPSGHDTDSILPLGAVARLKLLDFGLARPIEECGDSPTVSGTPAYMAPEQALGHRLDARCDIFGLGCVLYELCTGTLPFPLRTRERNEDNPDKPRPIHEFNSDTPVLLASLIERMLSWNPADRPVSVRVVEQELATFEPSIALTATVANAAAETMTTRLFRPAEHSSRRSLWRFPLIGVVALTLTIGLVLRLNKRSEDVVGLPATPATRASEPGFESNNRPPFPDGPPDAYWCGKVRALPSVSQFHIVSQKLQELNPGYDFLSDNASIDSEAVLRYEIHSNLVTDLSPLRALLDLQKLRCAGLAAGAGRLTDLSPLSELKLTRFECFNHPKLTDITPLSKMKLVSCDLSHTDIDSLAPLNGADLEELNIAKTLIRDLGFLKSMPKLRTLSCQGCLISDWDPLLLTRLSELNADVDVERDAAVLKQMPELKLINGKPVLEFLKSPKSPPQ